MDDPKPRHLEQPGYRPRHLKTDTSGPETESRSDGGKVTDLDRVEKALDRSLIRKNSANICVSALIVILGVSSFLYGLTIEPSVTIFRFLTVDGTLFTTVGALCCIVINIAELVRMEDVSSPAAFYIRFSMAVAESVIFIVVAFSQLPFFEEHLPVFDRYDSFVMHAVIPVLGVGSFLFNDSPIGRLGRWERLAGASYVTVYAVIIVTLISTERLPSELIPYFFLDYRNNGFGVFALAFVFVYGVAYLMGWILSEWNMKCSWLWFRDLAGRMKKRKRR